MKLKVLLAGLMLSGVAFAEDLKPVQEEAKGQFDEEIVEPLKATNDKCGTKLTVKTDFEKYNAEEWGNTSSPSWCSAVISAVGTMCERPAYKKAIAKKVTAIACLFAGVKPKDKKDGSNEFTLRNMSVEKGVFTFHMHKDQANLDDNAKATLEKAMN